MARRPASKSVESRLTAVERGIKSLQASDAAIIKEMRDGFARMESRFDQIYNHITHNPISVARFLLSEETRYITGANIHLLKTPATFFLVGTREFQRMSF